MCNFLKGKMLPCKCRYEINKYLKSLFNLTQLIIWQHNYTHMETLQNIGIRK